MNFLPSFLKYWVAAQEIGTYVLAEDKYQLNGGKLGEVEFGEEPKSDVQDTDTDTDLDTVTDTDTETDTETDTASSLVPHLN